MDSTVKKQYTGSSCTEQYRLTVVQHLYQSLPVYHQVVQWRRGAFPLASPLPYGRCVTFSTQNRAVCRHMRNFSNSTLCSGDIELHSVPLIGCQQCLFDGGMDGDSRYFAVRCHMIPCCCVNSSSRFAAASESRWKRLRLRLGIDVAEICAVTRSWVSGLQTRWPAIKSASTIGSIYSARFRCRLTMQRRCCRKGYGLSVYQAIRIL